jgi:NDP-sugar pyrophosphorylase family protein
MREISVLQPDRYGYDFIAGGYLPPGRDEYWQRNEQAKELGFSSADRQCAGVSESWRNLTPAEIETLQKNGNLCRNWNDFLVTDPFDPALIRNSYFYGLVRLGAMRNVLLRLHDFCVPSGIRNSTIISCDIGDDCAIQDCCYISHYIIGGNCILSKIDEMQCTNHAKFGNGVLRDGEEEDVRVWIDVMNEAGGRSILPFESMICADAFLWAAYRDDTELTARLKEITQEQYGGSRGKYGTVGAGTVIKSCKIIKDTAVGECAYIKGANKLKNITILSSADEPTQIGEGVEMVNGIAGFGCHMFYGSKAVRFVLGRNSNLKYGARLIHSVLGDNSTVSCCEILNNLIFPVHEQHHNNSFLIASLVEGISNMAAAATIGSNHNSRANDGEIRAKRGFWPGLAVSLKHSSCFASFVIISKGEYPAELNIPLPFSLVNNNVHKNRLEVMPAYFWLYNLYALERNSWKAGARDHRAVKVQRIETDYLAPDTAEEIIKALSLLDGWLGEAGYSPLDIYGAGSVHLIPCRGMEHSKRGQVIINPLKAIAAYRQMLRYYAVKTIAEFFYSRPDMNFNGLCSFLGPPSHQDRVKEWVNIGGQIVPAPKVDNLRKGIVEGKYKTWESIHGVYAEWDESYSMDRLRHSWAVLSFLRCGDNGECVPLSAVEFKRELATALETRRWIRRQILKTREKDFANSFTRATFRNHAEMEQVKGKPQHNSFVRLSSDKCNLFEAMIVKLRERL